MYIIYPFALYIRYAFKKIQKYFEDFMGISSANPYETSIVHLGNRGFEGLVAYAKCNRDSYDSELGFSTFALFYLKMSKSYV